MSDCRHLDIVPIFPAYIVDAHSTIDGVCANPQCGNDLFCFWEFYGYGDAAAGTEMPSPREVREAFDDWWEFFGTHRAHPGA